MGQILPQWQPLPQAPSDRLAAPHVVVVAGTDKECGKTALAEAALRLLPGAAAAKVTRVHEGKCPTGDDCGACDSLVGPYEIWSDISHPREIAKAGTDSARLLAASGGPAFWVDPQTREATLVALTSRGDARNLAVGIDYRVDTSEALDFINRVIQRVEAGEL